MSFTSAPQTVPPPQVEEFAPGLTLLNPQSRKGTGPGLIVGGDDQAAGARIVEGIPSPLMKWAEEGYTVVGIETRSRPDGNVLGQALAALSQCEACEPKQKVGLVCK